MITFTENKHEYKNAKKQKYTSVTTFIGQFQYGFNAAFWSKYKAVEALCDNTLFRKHLRKYGREAAIEILAESIGKDKVAKKQKEIKAAWRAKNKRSTTRGTKKHNFKENASYERGWELNPVDGKKYDVFKKKRIKGVNAAITENLYDLEEGFYPELMVWIHKFKIAGQADKVFVFYHNGFKWIDIGDYKGLCLSTPIFTNSGWKTMGSLQKTDKVLDGEGKFTSIKHISDIHYNPCYEITFDTGDTIIADYEHKWQISVLTKNKGTKYSGYSYSYKDMTSDEIFDYYQTNKKKLGIEVVGTKEGHIDCQIDPYVLGLWLADGNSTAGTITCKNSDIWEYIKNKGFSVSIDHNRNTSRCMSRTVYGLATKLRKYNLLNNKHIPDFVYSWSYEHRLEFLRGFMDGDGYLHRKRKRCVMVTTKKWQAHQLSSVISSLGMKPTIIQAKTSGFDKKDIPCFHVTFSPFESPFLNRNKDYSEIMQYTSKKYTKIRYITSVRKIDTVPTKCIAVDSSTRCYLAGHSFIKTHNTNEKITTENPYQNFKKPIDHLEDTKFNLYALQLSLYAYCLESFGFKIRNLSFDHYPSGEEPFIHYEVPYLKKEVEAMLHYSSSPTLSR